MSRWPTLVLSAIPVCVGCTLALAAPVSSAHANVLHDAARQGYRLGVRALDAVDATPAQRREISAAAHRFANHLAPLEDDIRAWAQAAHAAWVAPTVDRAEVEAVRHESIELLDAASEGGVDFVVDVAGTLTQAQRKELARRAWHRAQNLLDD